jgi:hypothetical protein
MLSTKTVKGKKRKKMGRKRKVIDWELVEKLCHIHCTEREIAHMVDCDINTLHINCQQDNFLTFSEFYAKYSAFGNRSLRRAQFHKALSGSATMQIWLGKQWLNQSDKINEDNEDNDNCFTLNYRDE